MIKVVLDEVEDYFNPTVFHDYSFQSGHFDGKYFSKYLDYDEYLEHLYEEDDRRYEDEVFEKINGGI